MPFAKLRTWSRLSLSLVALAAGLTVSSVGAAPSDAPAAENVQIVDLVNQQRAAYGLAPVSYNPTLAAAAQDYADTMASQNFFSHTGADGSTMVGRAESAGYTTWSFLAENLAGGQTTPERVVAAWMDSPGHRANILAPDATEVGLGHTYNAGARFGHYWALEFGARW
jgi:uncharacterized protein YkwD